MDAKQADTVIATMSSLTSRWFDDHLYRYLERLQDNFHRRALTSKHPDEQQALLTQQRHIRSGQDEAYRLFSRHLQHNIRSARPYSMGGHSKLDQLLARSQQLGNDELENACARLCRAISPMALLAGFQHLAKPLRIDPAHLSQCLSLFNVLILREAPLLYQQLLAELNGGNAETSKGIEGWIAHIEQQLKQQNLSAQQRALNELRLQRLRGRSRPQGDSSTLSDQQLIREAAAIFGRSHVNRRQLSASILASLNTLQTIVSSVALRDRQLFLNPLHPARQISHQLVASSERWQHADPSLQQNFERATRDIVKQLSGQTPSSADFNALQESVDQCCQQLVQSAKLNDRRKLHAEAGKRRITRLRRKVHALIDQKTHGTTLPASVDNLLYGPMTSILLYHWLRHGSNSDALRRNLGLVDDILWYIKPHRDWALLRKAKDMGGDIEQRLLDGLKRINLDDDSARSLVDELHQLRLIASGMSGISGQSDRP